MKSLTTRQQKQYNKYTGTRDDDSLSKNCNFTFLPQNICSLLKFFVFGSTSIENILWAFLTLSRGQKIAHCAFGEKMLHLMHTYTHTIQVLCKTKECPCLPHPSPHNPHFCELNTNRSKFMLQQNYIFFDKKAISLKDIFLHQLHFVSLQWTQIVLYLRGLKADGQGSKKIFRGVVGGREELDVEFSNKLNKKSYLIFRKQTMFDNK